MARQGQGAERGGARLRRRVTTIVQSVQQSIIHQISRVASRRTGISTKFVSPTLVRLLLLLRRLRLALSAAALRQESRFGFCCCCFSLDRPTNLLSSLDLGHSSLSVSQGGAWHPLHHGQLKPPTSICLLLSSVFAMSLCQTRAVVTQTHQIIMATQTITQPSLTASLRPSLLELYLTNLRLLDLDQRPDWPNITARTYAIRDAQNQKQRILCTEWALFRLFEMWSPDETQYVSVHRPSVILR
jgi:HAUS augmin-like complex subunit 6 N-terminus